MTQDELPDDATMSEFLAMMATENVPEHRARELASGLTADELRMLMTEQREAESEAQLQQRLVRARSDPRLLAAVLPRPKVQPALQVVLCLFCVGMLVWTIVMPFDLAGPLVGVLATAGAVGTYLAIRPLAKWAGWLSVGAFTVSRDGVLRVLSGIGQARRRIRKDGDDVSARSNMGVAVVFLLIVLGLPVMLVMLTGISEIMLGWMIIAMLALNEMVLLMIRTWADTRRRDAAGVDGQFGLAMIVDYLGRGGDPRPLLHGISLEELVPADESRYRSVMRDAILRRAMAQQQA